MAYTTQAKIEANLPPAFLVDALDDDRDGDADTGLLDAVIASADTRIDGILGQKYETPFSPVPAVVAEASLIFTLCALYRRRGIADDANPWAKRETQVEAKLNRIGSGAEMLTYETPKAKPSGKVIGTDALLHSDTHGILS